MLALRPRTEIPLNAWVLITLAIVAFGVFLAMAASFVQDLSF